MSSSNTLKKKKGHHKSYNRPDVVPSGMLDAYVDSSEPDSSKPSSKPVSTKNKNKKKLEQRRMEEAAKEKEEPKTQPQEAVILDSWEDIDPDFEPKTPFGVEKTEGVVAPHNDSGPTSKPSSQTELKEPLSADMKATAPKEEKEKKKKLYDSETQTALARINETILKMSNLFIERRTETNDTPKDEARLSKQPESKSQSSSEKKMEPDVAAPTKVDDPPSKDNQTKTKEEIKAEREAKKAAKAARRATTKSEVAPPASTQPPDPKAGAEAPKKSNAELKAERRAKQEAQRAAKAAATSKAAPSTTNNNNNEATTTSNANLVNENVSRKPGVKKPPSKKATATAEVIPTKSNYRKVMLFSHLPIYERNYSFSESLPLVNGGIHPVIIQLGLQYSKGTISGSNARCVSLMHALKRVISDYVTPPQKELSRDLHASLKPYINFLSSCRTLSVSMENALRYVKSKIMKIEHSMSDEEAKAQLLEDIDDFILVNIVLASKQISMTAREKIKDGDVILTYGHSSLVRSIFLHAAQCGVRFRVIVADSRPKFEGKEMIRHLVSANIKCTYVLISAVPYIIREVSKVIVGASSILANGTVNSRVGTSQVALIAKASNVPVLVCCETYKFSERVQTDSFVFNELGDPNDLVSPGDPLEDWQRYPKLNLLNLSYDITPASLVDAIISEISVIPGTSVPVVLRLKNSEANVK